MSRTEEGRKEQRGFFFIMCGGIRTACATKRVQGSQRSSWVERKQSFKRDFFPCLKVPKRQENTSYGLLSTATFKNKHSSLKDISEGMSCKPRET